MQKTIIQQIEVHIYILYLKHFTSCNPLKFVSISLPYSVDKQCQLKSGSGTNTCFLYFFLLVCIKGFIYLFV